MVCVRGCSGLGRRARFETALFLVYLVVTLQLQRGSTVYGFSFLWFRPPPHWHCRFPSSLAAPSALPPVLAMLL